MVAGQLARHKQRVVEIWLGNGFDGRSAERIPLHWKVADVVLVELDFQLLFERLRVETRNLAKDPAYLLGRHAVIEDEIEADLGQRKPKLSGGAINRAGGAGQIGPEIDDRNDFSVGHPTLPACLAHDRAETAERQGHRPPPTAAGLGAQCETGRPSATVGN